MKRIVKLGLLVTSISVLASCESTGDFLTDGGSYEIDPGIESKESAVNSFLELNEKSRYQVDYSFASYIDRQDSKVSSDKALVNTRINRQNGSLFVQGNKKLKTIEGNETTSKQYYEIKDGYLYSATYNESTKIWGAFSKGEKMSIESFYFYEMFDMVISPTSSLYNVIKNLTPETVSFVDDCFIKSDISGKDKNTSCPVDYSLKVNYENKITSIKIDIPEQEIEVPLLKIKKIRATYTFDIISLDVVLDRPSDLIID